MDLDGGPVAEVVELMDLVSSSSVNRARAMGWSPFRTPLDYRTSGG